MLPDLPRVLLLSVGAITVVLGLSLWVLDPDKRANRAFAAVLALKGSVLGMSQVPFVWPHATAFAFAAMPYLILPIIPAAVYFASVFPRRRGLVGRPGGGWWIVGITVVLWLLYLWRHGLFWTVTSAAPQHPGLEAVAGQVSYVSFGPLSLLLWATFPVFGILALLFVLDYSRTAAGPQRMSHFLVGMGFLVNALFDGTRQLVGIKGILAEPAGYPFLPWGWAAAFLPVLSLLPALAALGYMAWHHFERRQQEKALEVRGYVVAGIAVLAGTLPLVLPGETGFFDHPVLVVVLAMLRLALPAAVTYGLLRYTLFDVDVRVRRGLGYTLLAGLFGAAYFVVSETLEGRVENQYGNLSGLAAAALLTLFAVPLHRVTQRLAQVVVPPGPESPDAESLYAAQFSMLNEDGHLTAKERRCLDQLREHLGLALHQARRLEV